MQLGHTTDCEVDSLAPQGIYLLSPEGARVLLPKRECPPDVQPGDIVRAFLYMDSEDRPVATRRTPLVEVDGIAALRIAAVNDFGAFLDWGLEKDLMLPFRNQVRKPQVDRMTVVRVYQDEASGRIVATEKIKSFLSQEPRGLTTGNAVEVLVFGWTDTAFDCIVNGQFQGQLLRREIPGFLWPGEKGTAFVRRVRDDGRLDLALKPEGYQAVVDGAIPVIKALQESSGFLALHDASSPEEIRARLGMSKKVFKKVVGGLLREGRIALEPDGIRLLDNDA